MRQAEVVIKNSSGLHIRPATKIVKLVHQYPNCNVDIIYNNIKTDAKSILGILTLGITQGSTITLVTYGTQEKLLLKRLICLFDSKFITEN